MDQKISQLTEKTTLDDADLIPIVDSSANPNETKKITLVNAKTTLKGDPGTPGDSFAWLGVWVTATSYHENDCVYSNGAGYVCLVDHTSGNFATDLAAAKWSLFVQKGETGATGATGPTGATGANIDLLYGTSTTPPVGSTPDGTLYVTYTA